jgi:putative ABC transport system substrate-binding protein
VKRREFITAFTGAVVWPFAARAQQGERMRHIGVFFPGAANDTEYQARNAAFLQGLRELGWTDGRNVRIDYRWSAGDPNNIPKHAMELAALAPDVILAAGGQVMGPLLQATRTVPIVFVPPSEERAKAAMARSISLASRTLTGCISPRAERARSC